MDDAMIAPVLPDMDEMRKTREMVRLNLHDFHNWVDASDENARNIFRRHCMIGNVSMKPHWFSASPIVGSWRGVDA